MCVTYADCLRENCSTLASSGSTSTRDNCFWDPSSGSPVHHPLSTLCVGCESADNKKSSHTEKEMAQMGRQYCRVKGMRRGHARNGTGWNNNSVGAPMSATSQQPTVQFFYTRLSSPYLRGPSLDLWYKTNASESKSFPPSKPPVPGLSPDFAFPFRPLDSDDQLMPLFSFIFLTFLHTSSAAFWRSFSQVQALIRDKLAFELPPHSSRKHMTMISGN